MFLNALYTIRFVASFYAALSHKSVDGGFLSDLVAVMAFGCITH